MALTPRFRPLLSHTQSSVFSQSHRPWGVYGSKMTPSIKKKQRRCETLAFRIAIRFLIDVSHVGGEVHPAGPSHHASPWMSGSVLKKGNERQSLPNPPFGVTSSLNKYFIDISYHSCYCFVMLGQPPRPAAFTVLCLLLLVLIQSLTKSPRVP